MVGLRVGDNVAFDRVERMRDGKKFNKIQKIKHTQKATHKMIIMK